MSIEDSTTKGIVPVKCRPRLYEGMYIVVASLSEEAKKLALEKITKGIESRNGTINKIIDRGRSKLAYTIKKHNEGHYYLIYFTINSIKIKELWKEYRLNEDLLRFMTLEAKEVKEEISFKQFQSVN